MERVVIDRAVDIGVSHQRECVCPFDDESGPDVELCVEDWEAGATLQCMTKCVMYTHVPV